MAAELQSQIVELEMRLKGEQAANLVLATTLGACRTELADMKSRHYGLEQIIARPAWWRQVWRKICRQRIR